jgi:hypothetical protein
LIFAKPRWHAAEARFDFRIGVGFVPPPETAEGSQPSHASATATGHTC